jgi:hypothetical protein
MTIDQYLCEEGKRLNARILNRGGEFVVDPEQTKADYSYRVVDTGREGLVGEDLPCKKKIEIIECADDHAKVKVLGPSLDEVI